MLLLLRGNFWTRLAGAAIFYAAAGLLSFVIGQMLPRSLFRADNFIHRLRKWEENGNLYLRFGIKRWKDAVPDMSKIVPFMVKKKASLALTADKMDILVVETCRAETVHWALIFIAAPIGGKLVGGALGVAVELLYAAGNLPFIMIQRYNRPRFAAMAQKMKLREKKLA